MNWILKPFFNFFSNPTMLMGAVLVFIIIIFIFLMSIVSKPAYEVHYFSPDERIGGELTVSERHPKHLITSDKKKFLRFRGAYNIKRGMKNVTVWLAKRGTAYTFKLESTAKGKAVKVGTLWDGICAVVKDEELNKLKDEFTEPLKKSEIFVTVDLEAGVTPEGYQPLTEDSVLDDADAGMANLIGTRIREELQKEDWVRNAGLIGIGIALTYILQAMGIMHGFP